MRAGIFSYFHDYSSTEQRYKNRRTPRKPWPTAPSSPGSLAPETIRSAKTIEDTDKTEQERINAENDITSIYDFNPEIAEQKAALITLLFDLTIETKEEIALEEKAELSQEEKLELLKDKLNSVTDKQNTLSFTNDVLKALLAASEGQLTSTRNILVDRTKEVLSESIRKENIATARTNIESTIRSTTIDNSLLSTAIALGRGSIVETEVLNEE